MISLSDLIESKDLEDAIFFGVGCLYFDVEEDDFSEWVRHVREALEALPTVSDVEVEAEIDMGSNESRKTGRVYPTSARTDFRVHLSGTTQKKLLRNSLGQFDDGIAEEFWVTTIYDYHGPVTFVNPVTLEDPDNSSTSVIVVREYLETAINSNSARVSPCVIGPSPFHGDFALMLAEQDDKFSLERTESSAYDAFVFKASSGAFTTAEEAGEELFDSIKDELTFYYHLQEQSNLQLFAANEIGLLSEQLVAVYESSGILGRIRRAFTSSSKARYLAMKSIVAQYRSDIDTAWAMRQKAELYSSEIEPYFKVDIESLMAQDYSGSLSGAKEVASLISEVRARQIEVYSVFLSAIAGGAAGALISTFVH